MKSLVVTALFVSLLFSLPPEVESYREDLFQHHPALQAIDEKLKQNRLEQELATRLPDPMIGATVAIVPVETRIGPQRGVLSLSQTLPFPSLLKAKKSVKALGEPLLETTREQQKAILVAELLRYVTSLQEITKRVTLYEEYNRLIKMRIEVIEARYSTTPIPRRGVLSAELELIRNEDMINTLQSKYREVQIRFNTLMGYDPENAIALPKEFLHFETDLVEHVETHNLDLALIDRKIALFEEKKRVEKESLFPGITLGGKYIFNGESEMTPAPAESGKDAVQLFVNAPIPLNRKKNRLRVSLYEQDIVHLQAEKRAKERIILNKINTLDESKKEAERKIALSREVIIPKLQELQENSMELYSTGNLRFEELLLVERELIGEKSLLLTAQVSLIQAIIALRELMGETYETSKE